MHIRNHCIQHYGIKGMKWGIRRYQNADGTLTSAGKTRYFAAKVYRKVRETNDSVEQIVKSLSPKERKLLGGTPGTRYLPEDEYETVAKRFIQKHGDTPVAFLDVYYASNGRGSIALATRSGKDTRGKGYAGKLVKEAQEWLETSEAMSFNIDTLNWFARRENEPSLALANKYSFKERDDYKDDEEWFGGVYTRKKKRN